jgi:hypothetical protein
VDFGERSPSGGGTGRPADRMGLGIYRAVAARVSGRRMDGRWTLASVPRPRGGHPAATGVFGAGCRPCTAPLRHGGEDRQGERGKVGMRLTEGPTWW